MGQSTKEQVLQRTSTSSLKTSSSYKFTSNSTMFGEGICESTNDTICSSQCSTHCGTMYEPGICEKCPAPFETSHEDF